MSFKTCFLSIDKIKMESIIKKLPIIVDAVILSIKIKYDSSRLTIGSKLLNIDALDGPMIFTP
jgi:hypothetical protein